MLDFGITLSAMYLMPQFIQRGIGLPIAVAGVVLFPGGLMNAIFSLVAGKLYDKIGAKIPALCGFTLALCGAALLLFTNTNTPVWYVIACHVILLIGVPLGMSPSQTSALGSLPPELSTDGSSILNTMQQVWGAICTAVATSLLGIGMGAYGGSNPAESFTNGFHYGIVFPLILAALGILIAFRLPQKQEAIASEHPAESDAPIRAIMKADVFTIDENATLLEALEIITDKKVSGMPVVDAEGRPKSFISDGDILRHLANTLPVFNNAYSFALMRNAKDEMGQRLRQLLNRKVSEIHLAKLVSVDVTDDLEDICRVMNERNLRKVPVMENGKMVGILNASNITKYALSLYQAG